MKYNFKELVDVAGLQELTDELYAASSIASAIIGMDGEVITGSGWQRICTDFHRKDSHTLKDCNESDTRIREGLERGDPFVMYKCPRGLVDACSPIIIAGEHVANAFTGQVLLDPPDKSTELFFGGQAKEFGFDEEDYMSAFRQIPVFTEDEFRAAMSFVAKLAQMIAIMGLSKLRELEAMEKRLKERKNADESIQKSEERFRAAFESAKDCILIWDKDYNYLYANQAAIDHVSTTRDQVVGKNIRDGLGHVPDFMHTWMARVDRVFETGEGFSVQDVTTMQGQLFHTDSVLTPIRDSDRNVSAVCVVYRDVTDRKKTEQALQESEIKFREMTERVKDVLYRTDDKGVIDYISPSSFGMFGAKPEQMIGHPFVEFLDQSDVENAMAHYAKALSTGVSTSDLELRMKKKDGVSFWGEVNGGVIKRDGKIVGAQGMIRDITEQKQAQEALQESEEKYRLLAEKMLDVVWIIDLATMSATYFSPSVTQMRGYTVEEACVQPFEEMATPESIERVKVIIAESLALEAKERFSVSERTVELDLTCKDGSTVCVEAKCSFLRDDDGIPKSILGVSRNITERKQAQEALFESEKRMRSLIDQSPVSIQILDDVGRVIQANEAWEKLWGVSWEEFVKLEYNMLEDKQLAEIGILKFLEKAYEGEVVQVPAAEYDVQKTMESGNRCWVQASIYPIKDKLGKVVNIVLMQEDITDRRIAEEKLSGEKNFIDIAIDSLPGIFYLFTKEGKFLRWNRKFETISGYTADEIRTLHPREFFPVEEQPLVEERIGEVFSKGESSVEANWLSKDGTKTYHFLTGTLIEVEGIPCQVGMGIDISNRKKAEEDRAKLESQLRQAQKMESVGRLAGGVAHDFNNLLTGITGNVSLVQMDLRPDDPLFETLGEINDAADRATDLTRQLLAFSRKQIIKPKVINLNELIENMYRMLGRIIGEDVDIRTNLMKRLGRIKADPGQVEQIITNLAVNARDAMPNGGKLTLETADVDLDEEYCKKIPQIEPGKYVVLTISDNGAGMDKETQEHIFDPFFTTKIEGRGTGLGLATVYGIVKQHEGYVEVYSEVGAGTTFKIYFPLVKSKAETITRKSPLSHLPKGTETVFVVEDESIVRHIAVKILTRLGYNVISADDGLHALTIADTKKIPIDLLLTDIVMPNMNGRELAQELRKQYSEMKVLFTSGYTEDVIVHHGVLEEGLDFIGKPYTPQALAEKVRKVLDV